ncbi:hypothetical protein GGR55DRAFT_693975 [Xylaria sp. FL0064]|nr:hypothetical protein GGR55DRAFT_693975 [Xylaria sp. FL0064]
MVQNEYGVRNKPASNASYSKSSPRVPLTPAVGTWGQRLADNASIGNPVLPQKASTLHSAHPPKTVSYSSPRESGAVTLPVIPKPPVIDPRNLGSGKEALRSHPTRSYKETETQNRKFVIFNDNDGRTILKGPEQSTEISPRSRKGQVVPVKARDEGLLPFPSPESWETNSQKRIKKSADKEVPAILIEPPSPGGVQQQSDTEHLCVNRVYQDLHKKSQIENRKLNQELKHLAKENNTLQNLLPVAETLCAARGIKFNTEAFEALPQALEKILTDLNRARFAAEHHKRRKRELECRIYKLENELTSLRYDGDEDYIREVETTSDI